MFDAMPGFCTTKRATKTLMAWPNGSVKQQN